MKKILFITPYIPYPLDSGGNQAFFNMIDYIRHQMEVSILLAPHSSSQKKDIDELQKIWDNVNFYIFTETAPQIKSSYYYWILKKIKDSATRKMHRLLINQNNERDLAREKSTLCQSYFKPLSTQYLNYVMDLCQNFDIVQVEFYELISLGYLFPKDLTTIFLHHEIRYIHNENEIPLFKKANHLDAFYYNVSKDFEKGALNSYKYIITLTETDQHILEDFLGKKGNIYASPAVVHFAHNTNIQFIPTHNTLTFVGSESHYPNLDAVQWFVNDIAPKLRKMNCKFKFQVIGSWKSKHIKQLLQQCPEMELTGFVENLNQALNGSILLIPIRIGSGMRMKILDGINAQAPIITTSKGVEGLDFQDQKECLIADTADSFASTINQLLKDQKQQESLALHAKQKLQSIYNNQAMLEKRLKIYDDILSKK